VPHIVISNAFPNFDDIKNELISAARDLHRAQRGGPNGHSVQWFQDTEIPLSSLAMKETTLQHLHLFSESPPDKSSITFEFQFIEYNQCNDQYNWHIDGVVSSSAPRSRRMTVALNLTSQQLDFTGGGFQLSTVKGFIDNNNMSRVEATGCASALSKHELDILTRKNSVVIFNPDTIHRGSPIESGKRQLLTVWANW
jgi:2OG-Fe(II) oxygenase superfamily